MQLDKVDMSGSIKLKVVDIVKEPIQQLIKFKFLLALKVSINSLMTNDRSGGLVAYQNTNRLSSLFLQVMRVLMPAISDHLSLGKPRLTSGFVSLLKLG